MWDSDVIVTGRIVICTSTNVLSFHWKGSSGGLKNIIIVGLTSLNRPDVQSPMVTHHTLVFSLVMVNETFSPGYIFLYTLDWQVRFFMQYGDPRKLPAYLLNFKPESYNKGKTCGRAGPLKWYWVKRCEGFLNCSTSVPVCKWLL